jgi:hypothetical protein
LQKKKKETHKALMKEQKRVKKQTKRWNVLLNRRDGYPKSPCVFKSKLRYENSWQKALLLQNMREFLTNVFQI